MVEWALGGTTTTSAQGAFSFVAVAGTSVLAVSAENHKTRLQSGIAMVSGETVTKAVELVPETFDALPVPDTQSTQKIVTPADKADHLHQPFAAVVKNETLTASTCFAPYQEPVNIYLGITSDHPDLVPYFFLLNTGDQVTVL
ncbi:MAG TPA: hypothetical protein VJ946_05950, partial [Bacteroidales bacterium]|nr:hypothetical protein [Bacteroidales bacterium]